MRPVCVISYRVSFDTDKILAVTWIQLGGLE